MCSLPHPSLDFNIDNLKGAKFNYSQSLMAPRSLNTTYKIIRPVTVANDTKRDV